MREKGLFYGDFVKEEPAFVAYTIVPVGADFGAFYIDFDVAGCYGTGGCVRRVEEFDSHIVVLRYCDCAKGNIIGTVGAGGIGD